MYILEMYVLLAGYDFTPSLPVKPMCVPVLVHDLMEFPINDAVSNRDHV